MSAMYDYDRRVLAGITVPTDYAQAKDLRDRLEAEVNRTDGLLKALSGGGPMGLTPSHVQAMPEWKKAKREFDAAFAALRSFNATYVNRFKKEIAEERRTRRRS